MDESNQLFLMLGRLEGKLDASLSGQARIEARQDEHDQRLAKLETTAAQGTGAIRTLNWFWVSTTAALALFAQDLKGLIFR